jgi:hypothetical protein
VIFRSTATACALLALAGAIIATRASSTGAHVTAAVLLTVGILGEALCTLLYFALLRGPDR